MRTALTAVAIVTALGVTYLTYRQGYGGGAGFEGTLPPVVAVMATALVMALGILFGCLFRRMGTTERSIDILAEMRAILRSSSFVAAMCVSPFVFLAVYALVRDTPGNPASYLLAFQNGFFCEAIFRRMFREDGPRTAEQP